jgi:hypothetical protein
MTNTPTPQSIAAGLTEAKIIAWLETEQAKRLKYRAHIMSGGGPDYDLGRATGYAHAAWAIQSGAYRGAQPALVFAGGHASDCDWHCDQYPHECTCAARTLLEPTP